MIDPHRGRSVAFSSPWVLRADMNGSQLRLAESIAEASPEQRTVGDGE
ncbi:hypothetical protein HYG81_18815 [Natrinema zhouii]|nr:hypothetical protein [Natrinema zhouii]UHQ97911.1 hypothetical protein HYG81_18815 [Natrinema zhouii]